MYIICTIIPLIFSPQFYSNKPDLSIFEIIKIHLKTVKIHTKKMSSMKINTQM